MRRRLTRAFGGTLVLVVVAAATPAWAEPAHQQPQGPSKIAFAPDVPAVTDHEWNFRVGGFGGMAKGAPLKHVPVIFVHGNNVDAADWLSVREEFKAAGWSDQELWALSYNGLGGNNGIGVQYQNQAALDEHSEMGWDGTTRITNNDVNVPDLYDFILMVRAYTGSPNFTLVGHSLGVTLARKTLKVHPELRRDLVAFVGIAGANHGTTFCPPGSEGNVVSCNEIAAGTPWLDELNGPDGSDETYAPAKWLTVYDGSGAGDPAYVGPTYAQSPLLKGATNKQYQGTYHNDLRLSPAIIAEYRGFIEQAETAVLAARATAGSPATANPRSAPAESRGSTAGRGIPATGADLPLGLGLFVLGVAVVLSRARASVGRA